MRNRYVLVADLFAIGLCLLGAFVLRLDWFFTQSADLTRAFTYAVVAGVLAKPAVFHAFGLYRRYWRYAGLSDLLVVATAVSVPSATRSARMALATETAVATTSRSDKPA